MVGYIGAICTNSTNGSWAEERLLRWIRAGFIPETARAFAAGCLGWIPFAQEKGLTDGGLCEGAKSTTKGVQTIVKLGDST